MVHGCFIGAISYGMRYGVLLSLNKNKIDHGCAVSDFFTRNISNISR
jgi:hypothetical protein